MNIESASFVDYRRYYWREQFLFDEVGPRFRETGQLDAADFYLILIWKAERAKGRHKKRLAKLEKKAATFAAAVEEIASSLHAAREPEAQLRLLIEKWQFRLPTASAILTVLYPDEFTVYDVRICDELQKFHNLADQCGFSDKRWAQFWKGYQEFIEAVKAATLKEFSLRDKDRYLWGRSLHKQIRGEIEPDGDATS